MNQKRRWDIFCRIVDNFGDIGVCWRLARQLAHEHGLQVHLYIDDLSAAKRIIPALDISQKLQNIQAISIRHWQSGGVFSDVADVVIEAFACELPRGYLAQMTSDTVWVNLEYLSAEPWVADFHAKGSKFGHIDLTRNFFFPGFNQATGGLLREGNLIDDRDAFWQSGAEQTAFLQKLGVTSDDTSKISIFSYPNAPLGTLFHALSRGIKKTDLLVPLDNHIQQFSSFFGKNSLNVGDTVSAGKLTLHVLPFLSQDEYDRLLWVCDVNFVRGEDSWVRAIWAGKPFIWQPYLQSENTHLVKLNAFLEVFYHDAEIKGMIEEAHLSWSTGQMSEDVMQQYLMNVQAIHAFTMQKSEQLASQEELATKLVNFCNSF